jgi:hypothetical protein
MTEWIEAHGIDALERHRRDVLADVRGGSDPDHDGMCEALGDEARGFDPDDLEARWFDACIVRYRELFATGSATLHRTMSTAEPDSLVEAMTRGAHPGECWTWDETCATAALHPGDRGTHDLRVVADVVEASVSWGETLRCNFARPWELEIRVHGPVSILSTTALPLG